MPIEYKCRTYGIGRTSTRMSNLLARCHRTVVSARATVAACDMHRSTYLEKVLLSVRIVAEREVPWETKGSDSCLGKKCCTYVWLILQVDNANVAGFARYFVFAEMKQEVFADAGVAKRCLPFCVSLNAKLRELYVEHGFDNKAAQTLYDDTIAIGTYVTNKDPDKSARIFLRVCDETNEKGPAAVTAGDNAKHDLLF